MFHIILLIITMILEFLNDSIYGNNASDNYIIGIAVMYSPYTSVVGNNILRGAYGMAFGVVDNCSIIGNIIVNFSNTGIELYPANTNLVSSNNVSSETSSVDKYGITLWGTSANNTLLNNNIWGTINWTLGSEGPNTNYLIYNNSRGEIKWTNASFLNNLTTVGDLIFNDTGTIRIGQNYAYLDAGAFSVGLINSSANITLSNTTYDKSYPALLRKIMKDNDECGASEGCVNLTSFANNQVKFSVQSWSNYSIQKHVRDKHEVPISTGWNMISLKMEHNETLGKNKTIQVKKGWNLIGFSSDVNASLDNATFMNTTGDTDTFKNSAKKGKIQKYVGYMDRDTINGGGSGNNKKYKFVGLSSAEDKLKKSRGYWLYANEDGNLTIPDVGGSWDNETYRWSDLMFTNCTNGYVEGVNCTSLNITNAANATNGWIPNTAIYYWNTAMGYLPINIVQSANPWQGYFIWSNKENITMLRQN
jgi:parallel beta-helix repeat protein